MVVVYGPAVVGERVHSVQSLCQTSHKVAKLRMEAPGDLVTLFGHERGLLLGVVACLPVRDMVGLLGSDSSATCNKPPAWIPRWL